MGGVGFARVVVDHLFGIAVIGGDNGRAVCVFNGFEHAPKAGVNRGDGLYCGVEDAGVPDHVGVGKVANRRVESIGCDGVCESAGDFGRAHFGFVIVRGHVFGRWDEDAFFAIKGRFVLAVEEEGDVRVFFGFGDAKLPHGCPCDDLAAQVGHVLREGFGRVCNARDGYAGFVSGQGAKIDFGDDAAFKAIKVLEDKCAGDLPGPVPAKVEAEDAVPIFDGRDGVAIVVGDGNGFDKFVCFAPVVGVLDGCDGVGFADAVALGEQVVSQLGAFPAMVAVHSVIPPAERGHAPDAVGFEHGEQFAQAVDAALGRRVAAICEGVDEDAIGRETAVPCHFD